MTTPIAFEAGRTYLMRSVCDHDCVWYVRVINRTQKMVRVSVNSSPTHNICHIDMHQGVETIKPLGSYSMAPIASARQRRIKATEQNESDSQSLSAGRVVTACRAGNAMAHILLSNLHLMP